MSIDYFFSRRSKMLADEIKLQQYKEFAQEFKDEPVLGENKAIDRSNYLAVGKILNLALNNPKVWSLAFGSRRLYEDLTGSIKEGRLLQRIVYAHQPTLNEEIKLKWVKEQGFLFWHSAKQLAADTNINIHTIYRLIPKLAEEGWFKLILKQEDFGRKIYHFQLNIKFFLKRLASLVYSHFSKMPKCILAFWQNVSYIENKYKKENNIEQNKNFSEFSARQYSENQSDRIDKSEVPQGHNIRSHKSQVISEQETNSQDQANVPQVDEKINIDKPVLKKDMARHIPEGESAKRVLSDRYFGSKNQQSEIRSRAKMDSVLGFSEFKSVEDMRECQKQLTLYFAKKESPEKAADKASWMIKAEKNGERSPYVQDYLDRVPVGSWCQQEWEIEPGVIAPVLIAYLRCKLRKNGDTHAHSLNRVSWELKDSYLVANHWAECKRLIDIEKPRLIKALDQGQDLATTNIPEWIIEIYRPEIPVEQAAETAEVLGAIATKYNDRVEEVQKKLDRHSKTDSSLYRLKQVLDLPARTSQASDFSEEKQRREAVDTLMDKIVIDGKKLDLAEMLPSLPKAKLVKLQSEIEEISELLSDPITRETGLRRAKNLGLPILYSNEGEAIAIDLQAIKDDEEINFNNIFRDGDITSSEGKYQAHQIYTPEKIEKGSKSAWQEAIAKSKFLKNRLLGRVAHDAKHQDRARPLKRQIPQMEGLEVNSLV